MVYHGPSRGCWTCKRRRKKCDEVKPSCMRCINSKRTCGGYTDASTLMFRPTVGPVLGPDWHSQDSTKSQPATSLARKCTLSKRRPFPGTDIFPPDIPPAEITPEELDEYAVRSFLWDFCIQPTTIDDAKGFLRGLEPMLLRLGLHCRVAKAAMTVAGEVHRIILNRQHLGTMSYNKYVEVVRYLASAVQDPATAQTPETLLMATLLGLYEMVKEREVLEDGHPNPHANGVSAILQIENTPCHLLWAAQSGQFWEVLTGKNQPCSLFSFPLQNTTNQNLDDLVLLYEDIRARSQTLLSGELLVIAPDIHSILEEAAALDQAFGQWNDAQTHDFRPSVIGHMAPSQSRRTSISSVSCSSSSSSPPPLSEASFSTTSYPGSSPLPIPPAYHPDVLSPSTPMTTAPAPGFWPGRIDTYHDHYIAHIWNTYRSTRLSLIDIIVQLSERLDFMRRGLDEFSYPDETTLPSLVCEADLKESAQVLIQDILASVSFHLVDDLHVFTRDVSGSGTTVTPEEISSPGRPVGGLLLMYHIEAVMRLAAGTLSSLVPGSEIVHEYMRKCLLWIASEMGIGQAAVLARSLIRLDNVISSGQLILGVAMLL